MLIEVKNRLGAIKKRYFVLAAVLGVGILATFGDKGLMDLYKLRKERDRILAYNRSLAEESKALEDNIRLLKTDKRFVASIAKKELGMIGRNEIVYRFEDPR